jgi:hypothetical protein
MMDTGGRTVGRQSSWRRSPTARKQADTHRASGCAEECEQRSIQAPIAESDFAGSG